MSDIIDYKRLFDLSPNPYMVLDRELRYVAANEAYLRVTASRWEELAGRHVLAAFPDDPDAPDNANARMLRESFERVISQRAPDVLALIPYRVPLQTPEGILIEERFWSATHTPILDERGEVAFILQHTVDVTELQTLKRAARPAAHDESSSARLQAGVLDRARSVQQANQSLDAERRYLRRLFEQAPGFVAILRGPEMVFELANPAYLRTVGNRDILGKPLPEALPETVEQGFAALLRRVLTTGEPFVGRGVPVRLRNTPDAAPEELFLDFVYQPLVAPDGTINGVFVQGNDITEQKRAQDELSRYREHLEELVRERTAALERSEAERRQAEVALRQA